MLLQSEFQARKMAVAKLRDLGETTPPQHKDTEGGVAFLRNANDASAQVYYISKLVEIDPQASTESSRCWNSAV